GGSATGNSGNAGRAIGSTLSCGGPAYSTTTADSITLGDASGGDGGSLKVTIIPTAISGISGDAVAQSSATNTGNTGSASSAANSTPLATSGSSGATGDANGRRAGSGDSGATGNALANGMADSTANTGADATSRAT